MITWRKGVGASRGTSLRGWARPIHGLAEQVVDGADRAQLVFQEGQRAPVGNADLFVQTLQVFLNLVEFVEALKVTLECGLTFFVIPAGEAVHIPVQQATALLWLGVDVCDGVQDLLALGQGVLPGA
jgi:hypothetical protein